MRCFKSRGEVGKFASHRVKFDRERDQTIRDGLPSRQTISANNYVLHFGVIDFGHVQWFTLFRRFMEQGFDLVRAGFVSEISNERKAIEDGAGHSALLPESFLPSCIQPTIAGAVFRPASF